MSYDKAANIVSVKLLVIVITISKRYPSTLCLLQRNFYNLQKTSTYWKCSNINNVVMLCSVLLIAILYFSLLQFCYTSFNSCILIKQWRISTVTKKLHTNFKRIKNEGWRRWWWRQCEQILILLKQTHQPLWLLKFW